MRAGKLAVILFFLISLSPLCGEMVQGEGYSFFLTAPIGWVLDKDRASAEEADALLYPQGSTFQNAPSILYVSVAVKGDGFKDFKDLLRQDEEAARLQNPHLRLQNGPLLQTRLKKNVPLFLYLGLKGGGGEALVYVEEKEMVVIFTLVSSNEQILHEDLPALQAAVGTYKL